LLKAEEFRRYVVHPEWLRSDIPKRGSMPFVVIDEAQKVPQLLNWGAAKKVTVVISEGKELETERS